MSTAVGPPTRAGLAGRRAELLRQRLRAGWDDRPGIPRRAEGEPPPLSFAQERLWFVDQLTPGTAAYTVPVAVRLRGPVQVAALRRALDAVAARHEPLRMRLPPAPDGRPVLVLDEAVTVPLTIHRPDPDRPAAEREAAARRLAGETAATPIDLATGPPLRAALIHLGEDEYVLTVVLHHIAADGWSIDVFLRDLLLAYAGREPAEPPVRYGDYAAWQRAHYPGQRLSADLGYWRGQLAGVPVLDLPVDRPRPPEQRFRGAGHPVEFGEALGRSLVELGRRYGATPFMTLLAAYQALLYRYSGQDDFAVGSTVAGRTQPELEELVGLFANMLAIRADLAGDPTFGELVGRVRDRVLDAFAHQEMPFDRLVTELRVARDVSRSPVFQTTFTVLNYGRGRLPEAGLTVEPFPIDAGQTRFDLELYLYDPQRGGVSGYFIYDTELFHPASIERLAHHFERLLHAVVAEPETRLSGIGMLAPAERALVLHGWNRTAVELGAAMTLHGLVQAQVRRAPEAVAVVFDDPARPAGDPCPALTYRELDARADLLAGRLRGAGAGAGAIVAVCAERCLELVVGLLAVLKTGAAYLPLDPEYPPDRLAFMLADAAPRVVLATPALAGLVPPVAGVEPVPLTAGDPPAGPADPHPPADPGEVAYVIYTSGSTGRPKGVPNTHRGIHNRLDWMQRTLRLTAGDTVLQKTPAGFDVSVWEFFWPLATGARLVLARPGGHKDAAYLRDAIRRHGVTTVHFVPSMLGAFLATEEIETCHSLRRVICSGEALPVHLARALHQRLNCALYNLYGPTEAAIDVTAWECRPELLDGEARVPIGRPIQNTRAYVLDGAGEPVPVGIAGELHLAGAGLALGYLNRPGLTAQRFRPDPFGPPGERMYATGDRVRWRADGTLDYLGRLDQQVKLRGQRIEPGEIESVLRDAPGVREAVVILREDRPGDQRLVAYLVARPGATVEPGPVRAAIRAVLPEYLVPSGYVVLEALPVTANGKLDRAALPPPARPAGEGYLAPRTPVERAIAEVWAAVLDLARVGLDDDFFELGGHSLLATQAAARLRTALPAGAGRAGVLDLFKNPTVRRLAEFFGAAGERRGPRRLLHELTRPVTGDPTLTYICVPYGGGSAVVFQPLADALPAGYPLYSLAAPGHDPGLDDEPQLPLDELVERCVAEIRERVTGPVAVYGHCGFGGAMAVALARALAAAGRPVEIVYTGAIFPFARPAGRFAAWQNRLERLRSDRIYANWLTSIGLDLGGLDPDQVRTLVRTMRTDSRAAEEYFTGLTHRAVDRLSAPIVSVVGERDDATMYYAERFREWHFLTDTTALVVLDEAGHYFLKYRAEELAAILTGTHRALAAAGSAPAREAPAREAPAREAPAGSPPAVEAPARAAPARAALPAESLTREARGPAATWWLHDVSTAGAVQRPAAGPAPSMRRFLAVATGQMVSMTGSAMTEFAVPIWIYLRTGSLVRLALFSAIALVPGMLALPVAGALVDRVSRRRVMLAGDLSAGLVQGVFLTLLLTGALRIWHIYLLLVGLSIALTFQRLAYFAAVPQLVPKRYLGHANGVVQVGGGVAQFLVPVAAVGVMAAVGLRGILALDVASYAVAVAVIALLRFPRAMAYRRRETMAAEIRTGFRSAMGSPGFRAMLLFFASTNVFLGPMFILIQPLVLGFGPLSAVSAVAVAGGLGVIAGGMVMALWGGPARRRMFGVLCSALALTGACALTGLRPSVPLVATGVFGMFVGLTIMNTIYATIVQVKVAPRYHGRVFAVNTLFAFCTLPLGFVVVGPFVSGALEPLVRPGGALATTVGRVIGTGAGRGIGLMYLVFAAIMAVMVLVAMRYPALARFDAEVPDAEPDDLLGLAELDRRARPGAGATGTGRVRGRGRRRPGPPRP
jgi:amino acid adenylation domain-containing protein